MDKYTINKDHRVVALRDFADVKAGDVGGFLFNGASLSHDGNCWIYDHSMITDSANVSGNAQLRNYACVNNDAYVYGDAVVAGSAQLYNDVVVSGNAHVSDNVRAYDNVAITNHAVISGDVALAGNALIKDNAHISGHARLRGEYHIGAHANITDTSHVITMSGIIHYSMTMYRTTDSHMIIAGCQQFTLDDTYSLMDIARDNSVPWHAHLNLFIDAMRACAESWHKTS